MAAPKAYKKLRAKRARARQRDRADHDLRPHYRETDRPERGHLAILQIEDAFAPPGTVRPDVPPRRPLVTAIINTRRDPIARLYARHKITQPQYQAARSYQETYERANIRHG